MDRKELKMTMTSAPESERACVEAGKEGEANGIQHSTTPRGALNIIKVRAWKEKTIKNIYKPKLKNKNEKEH